MSDGVSVLLFVEACIDEGDGEERIVRRILSRQGSFKWDLPVRHHFWYEGLRNEREQVESLVGYYLSLSTESRGQLRQDRLEEERWGQDVPHGTDNSLVSPTAGVLSSPARVRALSWEQLWPMLRNMAWKHAHGFVARYAHLGRPDLPDLVQAGHIAAWEARETFRGDSKFSTFAYRVMFNGMYDYAQKLQPNDREVLNGDVSMRIASVRPDVFSPMWLDTISALKEHKDGPMLFRARCRLPRQ